MLVAYVVLIGTLVSKTSFDADLNGVYRFLKMRLVRDESDEKSFEHIQMRRVKLCVDYRLSVRWVIAPGQFRAQTTEAKEGERNEKAPLVLSVKCIDITCACDFTTCLF
jgi:hypothetical protein